MNFDNSVFGTEDVLTRMTESGISILRASGNLGDMRKSANLLQVLPNFGVSDSDERSI